MGCKVYPRTKRYLLRGGGDCHLVECVGTNASVLGDCAQIVGRLAPMAPGVGR